MSVNNLQMDIFIYNFFTIINLHFFFKGFTHQRFYGIIEGKKKYGKINYFKIQTFKLQRCKPSNKNNTGLSISIGGVMVRVQLIVGLNPGRVKPKTIKLEFVSSPQSMQH